MKRNDADKTKWAHISCITFMPGANVNEDNKTYHNGINPKCYKRQCAFCKTKEGAVVFCKHRGCSMAFHVLCGRLHGCVLGWDEEKVVMLISFNDRTTRTYCVQPTENRPTRMRSARSAKERATKTTCCCATAVTRASTSTA